jgi:hypothetical protein
MVGEKELIVLSLFFLDGLGGFSLGWSRGVLSVSRSLSSGDAMLWMDDIYIGLGSG